jgi:hypothetical protein
MLGAPLPSHASEHAERASSLLPHSPAARSAHIRMALPVDCVFGLPP